MVSNTIFYVCVKGLNNKKFFILFLLFVILICVKNNIKKNYKKIYKWILFQINITNYVKHLLI